MLTASSSLSHNIFGTWQPAYAERGLPTFPVKIDGADKKPAIRGWQNFGLRGSQQLAEKLASTSALGIALNRRRMIVDIDINSESVLADVLNRYGPTPLIARTASKGGYHAYYGENANAWRHYKNSRRVIRPEANKPIDYLGSGFAVVPPSVTASGRYEFIKGTLDDLGRLPPFQGVVPPSKDESYLKQPTYSEEECKAPVGQARNNKLWRDCMRRARSCSKFDELLAFARDINAYYCPPMNDGEVMKVAKSAWSYTERGENRFGQHGAWLLLEDVTELLPDPDTLALLAFLDAHNGPRAQFIVSNGLAKTFGWGAKRVAAARRRLIELGHIEEIRAASRHAPSLFQWAAAERDRG
jgi:Bifunctional DNA primase/polymerase, N-terminal/Primase C terminal 1 (PriCT-1)